MRERTQRLEEKVSVAKPVSHQNKRLRFVSGMVRGRDIGGPVGDTEPADRGLLGMAEYVIFRVIEDS